MHCRKWLLDVGETVAIVPFGEDDRTTAVGSCRPSRRRGASTEPSTLPGLASPTPSPVGRAMINQGLEGSWLETLHRLALAAESPDDGTRQHTERVALTSRAIARELGLPAPLQALIYKAAPLHDLGKLCVPDSILSKPGWLTRAEFEQVKVHTTAGGAMLARSASKAVHVAEEIALTHHEWWDGRGYPSGLRGEEIPLTGRIVALADVFDALTHERPYKHAWPVDEAVAEIRSLKGRQLDPDVVEAFLRLECSTFVERISASSIPPGGSRQNRRAWGARVHPKQLETTVE
jgi:HD-GYP domain-containing protein (c-di-GMP phosphodiesterase class II)